MSEVLRDVRVRIAPGPTGPFHTGRSRTALINWLFARHHGGTFVLRIEDTDQQRSKPEHLHSILESLRWLGLTWDEGPDVGGPYEPYFQMGRLDTYRECADRLIHQGNAYPCYCTAEELDALREQARLDKQPFRYPRTCRDLDDAQRHEREAAGRTPVLRLKIPESGATTFHDLVVGDVTVSNVELDDFVIMRANGVPTYNFAVVVDDLTMKISHVIRGQDHVPNTPRQILVYQYLGEDVPQFAHLPMVLGMDRGKISARNNAQPVTVYGNDGYLPDALTNYLGTIGISYEEEREIFSLAELVEHFDMNKIGKAGAAFDEEKLNWMNGVHIRALPLEEFVSKSLPFLQIRGLVGAPPSGDELEYATQALALEQERVRTLADTPDAVDFFLRSDLVYDPALLVVKKSSPADAARVIQGSLQVIQQVQSFAHDDLEEAFRRLSETLDLKTGIVFGTVRVALTGRTAAPPLFDTMVVLGRERVSKRLEIALTHVRTLE
ncbi:MAG: glutamate--tRNA ligase [Chloroflexota bacterium]